MAEQAKKRSATARLEIENHALRALTIKLGRIVLTSAGKPACGADNIRMPIFDTLAPDEIASALRALSLECERLVRLAGENSTSEDFEAIGMEFADMAARIEAAFRIPPALR